ncbi:MAG: hypothetical protein K6G18_06155 [Treponema sp.]|nr:hypothetical protein [Treponema sp.]
MMGYEKDHVWYMWARDGQLIIGDDVEKVKKDYFLGDREPDLQMTEQELDDCGRMVRVIDGGIVVGKTEKEKEEEDRKRAEMMPFSQPKGLQLEEAVEGYKAKLAETDYVVIKIAEGAADRSEYEDVLAQRAEWRRRIEELEV